MITEMDIYIPSFVWTIIYLIGGLWISMRIVAVLLQFLIKRWTGILVRIGTVRLGSFHKVHIGIRNGLHVEIDKLWLSSSLVNEEIRKPLVLCMGEVRIQADSSLNKERKGDNSVASSKKSPTRQFVLPKFATYLQHFGLKIQSLTVMLLKTMVPDCLIHIEGQDLGLDISCPEDSFKLSVNVGGVTCRALRSVTQQDTSGAASEPCLAEMSFSLYVDSSVFLRNIKHIKEVRVLVKKPQMMLTEGLFTSLQITKELGSKEKNQEELNNAVVPATDGGEDLFESLPQELGIDFTEVDIKIVRETKQRSLLVGIRTFHVDLINEPRETGTREVVCKLLVEDFSTKSQQAKFAELLKLDTKGLLYSDCVKLKTGVHGAYFHYHHEEVQYWILVLSHLMNKDLTEESVELPPIEQSPVEAKPSGVKKFLSDKRLEFEVDFVETCTSVSTATCNGLVLGVSHAKVLVDRKPAIMTAAQSDASWIQSSDFTCELEIDTLYCQQCDAQIPVSELSGQKHCWNHVLYMGFFKLKIKKLSEELWIDGIQDHLHIEWSSRTVQIALQLLTALARTKIPAQRRLSDAAVRPMSNLNIRRVQGSKSSWLSQLMVSVKFDVSNTNVFVCNNFNVGLMLRLDTVGFEHRKNLPQTSVLVEGLKVAYIIQEGQTFHLVKSSDICPACVSLKEVRINYKHSEQEVNVRFVREVCVNWTTASHMCIIQVLQDVEEFQTKLALEYGTTEHAPVAPSVKQPSVVNIPVDTEKIVNVPQKAGLSVNVIVSTPVSVKIQLSSKHSVHICGERVLMTMSKSEVVMEVERILIDCDDKNIITAEDVLLGTLPDCQLKVERESFPDLKWSTNRAWNVSMNMLSFVFPYNLDFAACFEEFVNIFKWLKLVHKVKRKPFTVESRLPPDLQIKTKVLKVELCDDPFEVKLGDNYELMKDEYNEGDKRRNVLDQKVNNLMKEYGIAMAQKVDELYVSLAKRGSEIFIQRSKKLYQLQPMRTKLFTWQMENVEIVALADISIHGKENVVENMKDIDADSPYPEEGLDFLTLWCRYISFSVSGWTIQLRDYPLNMLEVKDMLIWGRLIGAEQNGTKRAKRTCTVEVAEPWGNTTVERNLPALKFYHDFSCEVETFNMAYGACWEPAFAQYNISLDLINKPSIDPSRPLPFWDKIRLLLHGRLTMSVKHMSWLYHASLDPYNTTELMDWTWTNLILDWTNMKFVLKGDLDIYARTPSKYDDCKLLHLPNLKFGAKLEWLCHGDPNDHHSVMPCAPDKVPDYSLEEHDSFRAFRSQNMNLSISLETKRVKGQPKTDNPSCLFYASTLRFLDKIKICMIGVTRPVRRGPYFNNTKPRKPQLSRHYKRKFISLPVDSDA